MSKKSLINRIKEKSKINLNLSNTYKMLKKLITKEIFSIDFDKLNKIIQNLKRNAITNRIRQFCWHTGRISGFSNFFGLSRLSLRSLGQNLLLPGLSKSSW